MKNVVEVIQGFLIQFHIKPTKVHTKNNDFSQKIFEKMFLHLEITGQRFSSDFDYETKATVWTNLKNSSARLSSMKKLIFR